VFFADTSARKSFVNPNSYKHGRQQKIFQGGTKSKFCFGLSFSAC